MAQLPWLERLASRSAELVESTGLPRDVVMFVLTVVIGFVAALVARSVARKLTVQAARLIARVGGDSAAIDVGRSAKAAGTAVYWLVLLLTVMTATEVMGLPVVSTWFAQVASYLPRVIAAIVIVALGTIVAKVTRKVVAGAARSANLPAFENIGRATEIALLVAVGLVAVEQLGIEISLLTTVVLIVLAAIFGGAALAFGLGGRQWVGNILSAHYVGRLYQVGQTIRVGPFEGKIVRISEIAVVLECPEGEVAIPAGEFANTPSTLILRPSPQKGSPS